MSNRKLYAHNKPRMLNYRWKEQLIIDGKNSKYNPSSNQPGSSYMGTERIYGSASLAINTCTVHAHLAYTVYMYMYIAYHFNLQGHCMPFDIG